MVTMVMYVCVCVCLRSIFGSVRTQFIWNNLCQRNLIRPMNTWTVFFGQFQLLYECACVSDYFCSFPFWQTKYIKSMKLCLIWWQMTMMMMAVMVMATADVLPIITAMTMVWWWCWWMNEWKKRIERIKKLSHFYPGFISCHFSFEILSFVDIINILCVSYLLLFIFLDRTKNGNLQFSFQLYIFIVWYYHDEFVFNIYINIYLFIFMVYTQTRIEVNNFGSDKIHVSLYIHMQAESTV